MQKNISIFAEVNNYIKKYLAVLFLFLLLFPLTEKALHAFEHHDDIHCSITDKHFHEQEHECSICDFTITDSNGIPCTDVSFVISSQKFSYTEFISGLSIPYAYSNLPSRAPPMA